jgi:multidrug efflux pump subunit AcrB
LIGLVSKHGILIVEFANEMQKKDNLSPVDAVIKAASIRLRPILMTSFSTVIGIMPLVIASGAGAASRQSIGITIVSGFSIGTLFKDTANTVIYTFFAADHRPVVADDELQPSQLV